MAIQFHNKPAGARRFASSGDKLGRAVLDKRVVLDKEKFTRRVQGLNGKRAVL